MVAISNALMKGIIATAQPKLKLLFTHISIAAWQRSDWLMDSTSLLCASKKKKTAKKMSKTNTKQCCNDVQHLVACLHLL